MIVSSRSRARTNGATQTFRRPSLANRESNQNNAASIQGTGVYVPPHLNSSYQSNLNRNSTADSRYSKDQLLDLFRAQGRSGQAATNLSDLFVDGWNPEAVNGNSNGGWGKKEEYKDGSGGPEICWDHEGNVQPLALIEMGEEEKEVLLKNWDQQGHVNPSLGIFDFCKLATQASSAERNQRKPSKQRNCR